MAPLTIILSFVLAIAANLPRFFELQVILMMTMTRMMILIMIVMINMHDDNHDDNDDHNSPGNSSQSYKFAT